MVISSKPIASMIASYGVNIFHKPAPRAMVNSPWKAQSSSTTQQEIKGIIQRIRAEQHPDIPEGGLKAVMVLLVKSTNVLPKPGDQLIVDDQTWRIATILPLTSDRSHTIIETMVTTSSVGPALESDDHG